MIISNVLVAEKLELTDGESKRHTHIMNLPTRYTELIQGNDGNATVPKTGTSDLVCAATNTMPYYKSRELNES